MCDSVRTRLVYEGGPFFGVKKTLLIISFLKLRNLHVSINKNVSENRNPNKAFLFCSRMVLYKCRCVFNVYVYVYFVFLFPMSIVN